MKKLLISIFTLFLFTFCSKLGADKEPDYSKLDTPKEIELVSIPYTLQTAAITKVSYDNGYSIKSGDKLHITGTDRSDISGYLEYDDVNNEWSGDLWYNPDTETGGGVLVRINEDPNNATPLTVTLVHAGNDDESTYAHSVAGTFTEAVEYYSLLEGDILFGEDAVTLHQKGCFINASINFRFIGVGYMPVGQTSVDVVVGTDTLATGKATFTSTGETNVYNSTFVIVVPGGTELTAGDSFVSICDRNVPIRETTSVTLVANKSYNISRTYDFKPELGDPYWSDGTYGRIEHQEGTVVVGIIVFVNNYDDNDNSDLANTARALTEKDYGYGHALVMSLNNAASDVKWRNKASQQTNSTTYITSPAQTLVAANVSGYHNSSLLAGCTSVDYALNYRSGDTHLGSDSGWFLPTIGQWIYSISTRGFGGADPVETWIATDKKNWLANGQLSNLVGVMKSTSSENALVLSLNNRMEVLKQHLGCDYDAFGMSQWAYNDKGVWTFFYGDNYWTSSENDASKAIRMNFGSMETINGQLYSTIKTATLSKSSSNPGGYYAFCIMKVRPFLAF